TFDIEADADILADEFLAQTRELVERPGAARAQTWHRFRRSALERLEKPPRSARNSARLLLGVCVTAVIVPVLLLVLPGPEVTPDKATPSATSQNQNVQSFEKVMSDGWREIDLQDVGILFASPDASFRLPEPHPAPTSEYAVSLDKGELCAQVAHRDPV